MTKARALQVPPGAVLTLDDGLGFVALVDRRVVLHAAARCGCG